MTRINRRTFTASATGLGALSVLGHRAAWSQESGTWPSRPVRILVGFTPGGVPDIAARVLSQKLTEPWKQPIIVENRLGAGSNVAAQAVAEISRSR